jgi:hypothetical protein
MSGMAAIRKIRHTPSRIYSGFCFSPEKPNIYMLRARCAPSAKAGALEKKDSQDYPFGRGLFPSLGRVQWTTPSDLGMSVLGPLSAARTAAKSSKHFVSVTQLTTRLP